ncbi:hypothetical protein [Mycoplasma leonicaptivi]|uniref:hypothetical protein n=1 Tax=Mycoplasma leonicaptivi TaxID=36742 RepID=UPI00048A29E3|nr:hypothetical protein [Mycoplasma leonicaptivi]
MKQTVDIEKLKILAEEFLRLDAEAKNIKKEVKDLLKGTDVEINERLSNGGKIIYVKPESQTKLDRKAVSDLLYKIILDVNKNPEENKIPTLSELEQEIKDKCLVEKEFNWKLSIKHK